MYLLAKRWICFSVSSDYSIPVVITYVRFELFNFENAQMFLQWTLINFVFETKDYWAQFGSGQQPFYCIKVQTLTQEFRYYLHCNAFYSHSMEEIL